jgi:hypothetical protein
MAQSSRNNKLIIIHINYLFLANKYYNTNQQDTQILEDPDNIGKMTSETKQAMMAYLEVDVDDELSTSAQNVYCTSTHNFKHMHCLCLKI